MSASLTDSQLHSGHTGDQQIVLLCMSNQRVQLVDHLAKDVHQSVRRLVAPHPEASYANRWFPSEHLMSKHFTNFSTVTPTGSTL